MTTAQYPKRLIEVDLPIKRISEHARREKSIRHGHISTLHIWWARRPLASCRAVICASLWPDPADPLCPAAFREVAARVIQRFAEQAVSTPAIADHCSAISFGRWTALAKGDLPLDSADPNHLNLLRYALLDFIADFANWDNSTSPQYLETARALTQSAHEALGGAPGTRPLVVDPFAGGGSIPLEALRVGADAFASDLNPVAVLLNKVVLEYIPKYGQCLADEVRKWGEWIKQEAEKELAEFYPKDPDGATPIAYLWARTIQCEGPGCGAEVPLLRSLWLAKKANRSVALQLLPRPEAKRVDFRIIVKQGSGWVDQDDPEKKASEPKLDGTVRRGSATCPCCGYTTPVDRVRQQLKPRRGGADDGRLMAVVTLRPREKEQGYRLGEEWDIRVARSAANVLVRQDTSQNGALTAVPNEKLDVRGIRHTWAMIYGPETWGDYFTSRQALVLSRLARLIRDDLRNVAAEHLDGLLPAVQTLLALAMDKGADYWNTMATWMPRGTVGHGFTRQAVPMTWDFVEANPLAEFHCAWHEAFNWVAAVCEREAAAHAAPGRAEQASATEQELPDAAAHAFITDPPYYDAVPYAYLSDFFYVWLRRALPQTHAALFRKSVVPKDEEIVVDRPHAMSNSTHDTAFYERELTKAFAAGRRVLRTDGVGTIVFASKTTASWEAILKAVVDAGWIITGSWPIDTEREARISAQGQARLASSVHLVCRPRENPDGPAHTGEIGDWRDVLSELPGRIHDWMPRLVQEGVVGADAIFACLGPALEIFSRYERVEKASGEEVSLGEYLEHVWAAVAREAMSVIFREADATGFEPDARLTAMWLWTLSAGTSATANAASGAEDDDTAVAEEDDTPKQKPPEKGFALEFDAARKIAQGLGANLERLTSLVQIKGDTARLLPVAERVPFLFKREDAAGAGRALDRKARRGAQIGLFAEPEGKTSTSQAVAPGELPAPEPGETVLDRLHQAMLLFGRGRGDALRSFLVDNNAGDDERFWRLAQALSALYPGGTDEKRWVDGVLARKKGLGF